MVAGAAFTWSSSDPSVAAVHASGLVKGFAEGGATNTAMTGDTHGVSVITVVNPDHAALVALYEATDGPNWLNSDGWLTDAPLREWYGVSTNADGRVDTLDLSGNSLTGEIPPELGNGFGAVRVCAPRPRPLGSLPDQRSLRGKTVRSAASRRRTTCSPTGLAVGLFGIADQVVDAPVRRSVPASSTR